jgi:hypothetical protein
MLVIDDVGDEEDMADVADFFKTELSQSADGIICIRINCIHGGKR